ncbi:MAG: RDD family protein [Pontibacterium sp.]
MPRAYPETFDQVRLAPPAKRLIAFVYDLLLVMALILVTALIANLINGGEAVGGAWWQSTVSIVVYAFYAFFWTRNGQTLGLQSWRLRIQTPEGERPTLVQCLLRLILSPIGLAFTILILFWPGQKPRMSWQDTLSGTCMVYLPKPEQRKASK